MLPLTFQAGKRPPTTFCKTACICQELPCRPDTCAGTSDSLQHPRRRGCLVSSATLPAFARHCPVGQGPTRSLQHRRQEEGCISQAPFHVFPEELGTCCLP